MFEIGLLYKDYISKLKKDELIKILEDYNKIAQIYSLDKVTNLKAKKEKLIECIEDNKNNYIKYVIMSFDLEDFSLMKKFLNKKSNSELSLENKTFITYLIDKKILWQSENLVIPSDVYEIINKLIKDKEVINYIKGWNKIYKVTDGMIVAYGVVDYNYYCDIISELENKDMVLLKLNYYYKKEYSINDKMLVSNKLNSKRRINKYYKDKDYKKFSIKEYEYLGNNIYHHNIKSYKKFIKILKNNYVFKKKDIEFVDRNIIIPYLYHSLNEENNANETLEKTIMDLFEFKNDSLKQRMLKELIVIRNEFPLWEYRGKSKGSVL